MAAQSSPNIFKITNHTSIQTPQLFANLSPTSLCRAKIILAVGRIAHQMGYASGGYGKHAPGHLEPADVFRFFFFFMAAEVLDEVNSWSTLW